MTPAELARFEAKVSPEPMSGCWLWTGAAISAGYGYFTSDGKTRRAHRVSFEHFSRPLLGNEMVCHRCDNRICVNPEHLFAGSASDNQADCVAKGRAKNRIPPHPKGIDCHLSKLSEADVLEIRRAYRPKQKVRRGSSPASSHGLAERFGVLPGAIMAIVNRRTWRHVP